MKLTLILLRRNRMPNGHIFRGKERLVKQVESKHLRRLKEDFAVEEQNMFYLRFPYLTEAESSGHAKALGKCEARREEVLGKHGKIFKEDVTLYERLQHLRVGEKWE
ncbi:hypothetical protein O3G_MSEX014004 [Manduca sexta]|uniref:Ribosomal protein 63, mitochondrial n=1 Tax=Manduca sexta TaxID=7130 RepID=A0A921ZSQ4_MANSE|nr:hypothetical protein O3G_MSEX014004 [Manduca sexta]